MWNLTGNNATSKPGRSLLPVLTILFLVSYGLLTMLVVEQGRTIDSQRSLIQMLFSKLVSRRALGGIPPKVVYRPGLCGGPVQG